MKRSGKKDVATISGAGVPPHDAEAEGALIGALLVAGGGDLMDDCLHERIRPEYFFRTAHRVVYEAMLTLHREGRAIDEITLCDRLRAIGELNAIGGPAYFAELTARVEVAAFTRNWIDLVRAKYFQRRIILTGVRAMEKAHRGEDRVDALIDEVERDFLDIGRERAVDTAKDAGALAEEAKRLLDHLIESRGAATGLPSGFPKLDEMTLGFQPGQMIVIAARPGMGKTTIALNHVEAALFETQKRGVKPGAILFFSLEMTSRELMMRMISARARIDLRKATAGYLGRENRGAFERAADEYAAMPLFIDDTGGQTILDIRSKARRQHLRTPLSMVIVDYLQLIVGTDPSVIREQQIAEASRSLKALAKELNVPVLALAQLNRKPEDENRAPRMSDLRESGSIEQDADVVLLISKASKRAMAKGAKDDDEFEYSPTVERQLIIAKQRNGPTGDIPLLFNRPYARFENPDWRKG